MPSVKMIVYVDLIYIVQYIYTLYNMPSGKIIVYEDLIYMIRIYIVQHT